MKKTIFLILLVSTLLLSVSCKKESKTQMKTIAPAESGLSSDFSETTGGEIEKTPTDTNVTPARPTEQTEPLTETRDETPTDTPVEPTETPIEPTETPIEPTEAPTEPTETPIGPTVSPTSFSSAPEEPSDADLVPLDEWLPEVLVDLKYATKDNFTGKVIYENGRAFLRYGTVKKLKNAAAILDESGLKLKIWDAYRPVSAQYKLWEICPDPKFVSDPTKGFSKHSRGGTVDITLCTSDGNELEMPSGFDDFSKKADRDYTDVSENAAKNARLLESVLYECGFVGYSAEWWHYNDTDNYDVILG